jgi:hypothetical protein
MGQEALAIPIEGFIGHEDSVSQTLSIAEAEIEVVLQRCR